MHLVVLYAITSLLYTWFAGSIGVPPHKLAAAYSLITALAVLGMGLHQGWDKHLEPKLSRSRKSGLAGAVICIGSLVGVVHKNLLAVQILMRAGTLILSGIHERDKKQTPFRRWCLPIAVGSVAVVLCWKGGLLFVVSAIPALALYLGGYHVKYGAGGEQKAALDGLSDVEALELSARYTAQDQLWSVAGLLIVAVFTWKSDTWKYICDWRVWMASVGSMFSGWATSRLLSVKWKLSSVVPVIRAAGLIVALAVEVFRDGRVPDLLTLSCLAVLVVSIILGSIWR